MACRCDMACRSTTAEAHDQLRWLSIADTHMCHIVNMQRTCGRLQRWVQISRVVAAAWPNSNWVLARRPCVAPGQIITVPWVVVTYPLPEACSQCLSEPLDHFLYVCLEGIQAHAIDIDADLQIAQTECSQ